MKKALIFLAIAFVGCQEPNAMPTQRTGEFYNIEGEDRSVRVIIIDGCEYLYLPSGQASWCTHKGNCNNPIHYIN
jgi:hypothetical protein